MPHVITLTGPSGSGKTTVKNLVLAAASGAFRPHYIPKFTTRPPRADDANEVICVPAIPDECDIVYEQYEARYGLSSATLYDMLKRGASPVIVLNDVRVVEDLRSALGETVRSIYVFRTKPSQAADRELAKKRGVKGRADAEKRFRKAQAIYRIYIENIHLFDHVILNVGTTTQLAPQVEVIVASLRAAPARRMQP